jgi:hypothetical protein
MFVCTGMMYCCTDVGGDGGESISFGYPCKYEACTALHN